jgi:type IV secretory pathway TrbD component
VNNKEAEKKAMMQQQYAMTALVIMTGFNAVLAALMISKVLPILIGVCISFLMMTVIILKAQRDLLDDDERMWESPKKFHERMRHRDEDYENGA